MTTESVTAPIPYISTNVPLPVVPAGFAIADLFESLRTEHFKLHPDHEPVQYPDVCVPCRAIVGYLSVAIEYPVSPYGNAPASTVFCSECGLPVANGDLLAEHQATVHRFTDDYVPDSMDVPLEDQLESGV